MVHAALTLTRAWIVAGMPRGTATLGSYEQWAATIGGILQVAGIPGFLGNLEVFYENADVEGAALRELVSLWWATYGGRETIVAELFLLTYKVDGLDLGKGNDRARKTSFGILLAHQRDRVFGDHRVVQAGVTHKVRKWRLVPTASSPPASSDRSIGGVAATEVPLLFPLAQQDETRRGGYLGVPSHSSHAGENETLSSASGGEMVPRGTPGLISHPDLGLCAKGKPVGVPELGGTPTSAALDDTREGEV